MNIISTTKAPGAIGPYSQGYEANGFVFTSGQIAIIPGNRGDARGIKDRQTSAVKISVPS